MSFEPSLFAPKHFLWSFAAGVATITLNRPERKNPLTFDSYAELRDTFRALCGAPQIKAVVITGAGGNFCSGGDVMTPSEGQIDHFGSSAPVGAENEQVHAQKTGHASPM